MYGRAGLDRFKKAQSLEPFSVTPGSAAKAAAAAESQTFHQQSRPQQHSQLLEQSQVIPKSVSTDPVPTPHVTQVGGGQSTWQPPDWAIEPRPGFYYLEVLKDGDVLDRVNLDRRRHIFGRQFHTCDYVLDHQSVSRQHAAVVPHKNGSIYVIDLGSAHGTFVANERLTKESPVELEVGQSLRFAASTRTYVLRKNNAALFPPPPLPSEIKLPPPPDPSDEEAVVAYNTILNRYCLDKSGLLFKASEDCDSSGRKEDGQPFQRPSKKIRKTKVSFRDQAGGELVEIVGVSDGVDVGTDPGPVGVEGGSLVGKYESLVQSTVIPKGKEQFTSMERNGSQTGVTHKLQEILTKVKSTPKGGIYDDLFGESMSGKVGSSWAYSHVDSGPGKTTANVEIVKATGEERRRSDDKLGNGSGNDDDDLFGD